MTNLVQQEFRFSSKDGLELFGQSWQPEKPIGVICLVHGLGEHSGRYSHWAGLLANAGFATASFDLRGHGRSGGLRGHSPSFESFMQDIDCFLGEADKRFPGLPRFLYGHSLGGILALSYVLRRRPSFAGVVITSPGLRTAIEKQKAKVVLAKILGALTPATTMKSGLDPKAISRDPAVVERYINDPLVHDLMSLGMGKGLLDAIPWAYEHAGEFSLPLLLMHGTGDQIAYSSGSEEFAGKVKGDLTLKLWPGQVHELHNEPEKETTFAFLEDWLKRHLPA